MDPITDIALNDTWGGSGIKQGTEGRLVDHIVVRLPPLYPTLSALFPLSAPHFGCT